MDELVALVLAVVLLDQYVVPGFAGPGRDGGAHPADNAPVVAVVLVASAPLAWIAGAWLHSIGLGDLLLPVLVAIVTATAVVSSALLRLERADTVLLDTNLLAVVLLTAGRPESPRTALSWAAGIGAGYVVFTVIFSRLRERLATGEAPVPFRGVPLMLFSAGIFILGCSGFAGVLRG